jgi:hypothetical protein
LSLDYLLRLKQDIFKESIEKYTKAGLGGRYWWNSIDGEAFLTRKEREKTSTA